jgi:DNA-binding winged helix-turn-helix (wHTH) protein
MKTGFGDFTLDTALRQLNGPAGDVHVSPKAFDLLALLVEHRSRALSKAELQERLWPETFVVETNLASLIAELRDALNDDAKNPRFIRTAHRFGYAFCGTIVGRGNEPESSPSVPTFSWLLQDGRRIPLRSGENVVGRDPDGTVRIDSPSVSRRHARIRVSERHATIEDLDSKNGTYVRGERVTGATRLADGDEVRLGSVALQFRRQCGPGSTMTASSEKPAQS